MGQKKKTLLYLGVLFDRDIVKFLPRGNFTIWANDGVVGQLHVVPDDGIIAYNGIVDVTGFPHA